jgi:cytochrome c5|uniref:c-type cytochrome n=1 Tax=Polynucleobacter sp. TaxID=2029855 RepID=UPI004048D5EB
MKKISLLIAVVSFSFSSPIFANGEAIYKQVCMACHASGVAGAPKLGDKVRWAPLIKEGQTILTAHGYVGVRGMPAKGGKPDLSVEHFAQATVYMVNQSGGAWKDPDAKALKAIDIEIEAHKKESAKKK